MQRMSVRINMTVSNKIMAIQAGVVSSVLNLLDHSYNRAGVSG